MKIDMTQEVLNARRQPIPLPEEQRNFQLADLVEQALVDETDLAEPIGGDEKRRRWRLSVAIFASDIVDLDRSDEEYILARAAVMLSSVGFGMLEDAFDAARKDEIRLEITNDGQGEPMAKIRN